MNKARTGLLNCRLELQLGLGNRRIPWRIKVSNDTTDLKSCDRNHRTDKSRRVLNFRHVDKKPTGFVEDEIRGIQHRFIKDRFVELLLQASPRRGGDWRLNLAPLNIVPLRLKVKICMARRVKVGGVNQVQMTRKRRLEIGINLDDIQASCLHESMDRHII